VNDATPEELKATRDRITNVMAEHDAECPIVMCPYTEAAVQALNAVDVLLELAKVVDGDE